MVIGTVCYNNWRCFQALFGADGPPWPLTALRMAEVHAQARQGNSFLGLAPVGGLTGSSRLSLGALSSHLGLQQRTGQNTEQYHCFLSFLYCEHVSNKVAQALEELRQQPLLVDVARRNESTKAILQRHFYLHGLTLEHQSRYPKSRLFGYLPRQLLHEPRDALGSAACGAAGRCPWSRVHSNATRIGARTCAESIGFSRRPNPLPPRQVPKKSTPRPDLCCIDRFLPVTQPITTKAGSQKVDFLTTSQIYHRTSSLA